MSFYTLLSRIVRACQQRAEIVHAGVRRLVAISPMTESSYLRSELNLHTESKGGSINVDRNHFTYHPGYYFAWRI